MAGQSQCQQGKELRLAGRVGLYLRGQVHAEALCSFSDSRPGGKGHLDLNNVGFLCSREAGSHSRTEYVEPSEAGARPGLTVGGAALQLAGNLWTPPHYGAVSSS